MCTYGFYGYTLDMDIIKPVMKDFKYKHGLTVHEQVHRNVTFPCTQCGKNFKEIPGSVLYL